MYDVEYVKYLLLFTYYTYFLSLDEHHKTFFLPFCSFVDEFDINLQIVLLLRTKTEAAGSVAPKFGLTSGDEFAIRRMKFDIFRPFIIHVRILLS